MVDSSCSRSGYCIGSGRSCWAGLGHRWSGKSDGMTRCRVQPCFPPHVACWKAAYVSHGALLVTAFPLLIAEVGGGGGTECERCFDSVRVYIAS